MWKILVRAHDDGVTVVAPSCTYRTHFSVCAAERRLQSAPYHTSATVTVRKTTSSKRLASLWRQQWRTEVADRMLVETLRCSWRAAPACAIPAARPRNAGVLPRPNTPSGALPPPAGGPRRRRRKLLPRSPVRSVTHDVQLLSVGSDSDRCTICTGSSREPFPKLNHPVL